MVTQIYSGLTIFDSPTGNFIVAATGLIPLDDGGAGDPDLFEVGEALNGALNLFVGTVTVSGTQYPVTDNGVSITVHGVQLPPGTNFSSLGLIDTSDFTPCFLTGTKIDTPTGTDQVQDLEIGEQISLQNGGETTIKWIGYKSVSTIFRAAEHLMPVRFATGSLGDDLPHSDLTVTADHAMLIDGVLCNASALINGTSIICVPLSEMGETFTVYHIETENHEIILANGAPTETFIDNVSRRVFDNFAEYEALYGDEVAEMTELPLPRAMSARQVPASIHHLLKQRCVA